MLDFRIISAKHVAVLLTVVIVSNVICIPVVASEEMVSDDGVYEEIDNGEEYIIDEDYSYIDDTSELIEEDIVGTSTMLNNPVWSKDNQGKDVVVWDCIWFGNYWQTDTNGDGIADKNDEKQPIKWRVLETDGNTALLLSDEILDYRVYNEVRTSVVWKNSTIRSWLNGYDSSMNQCEIDYSADNFIDAAFSSGEQSAIYRSYVKLNYNPDTGATGGDNTRDYIFLLSLEEALSHEYGFLTERSSDIAKIANISDYSKALKKSTWWLRSPGNHEYDAMNVFSDGHIQSSFVNDICDFGYWNVGGIRPALQIDLSSSCWSYAGTVCSDEAYGKNFTRIYYNSENLKKSIPFDIFRFDEQFKVSSGVFNTNFARTGLVLSNEAYNGREKVYDVMEQLGFDRAKCATWEFEDMTFFHPVMYCGYKKIDLNGNTNVFCIDIKGTQEFEDVVTDVIDGSKLFEKSSELAKLKLYLYMEMVTKKTLEDLKKEKNIFFITGHSLGGAVANRMSELLVESFPTENIFTYTFEAPHTSTEGKGLSKSHNIINVFDAVPKMPPWPNATTYGNNYFFKRSLLGNEEINKIDNHSLDLDWISIMKYEHEVDHFASDSVYSDNYWYKLLQVACPVDMKVYDGDVLVAETIDNVAYNYNLDLGELVVINGDEKYFFVNVDKDYRIEFVGIDSGTMDYSVKMCESDSGDVNVIKSFSDVTLEAGKQMVSLVDTSDITVPQSGVGSEPPESNGDVQLIVLNDDSEAILEVSENGEEKEIETPTVYTVYYDSDGGNEIAPIVVRKGTPAVLPQPPVKEGFVFKGWQIDGSDYDFTEDVESNITLKAVWEKEKPKPVFNGHSLLLSGEIGVNFRVDYPNEGDYSDSVMRFDVGGYRNYEVPFSAAKKIDGTENSYRYTCYVNSLGMADEINATLTYGDNAEIENRYSVKQYVDYITAHQDDFSGETVRLVESISDYGHYVQPFITESGVTDGYAHIDMTAANEYEDDDVQAAKAGVSEYRIDKLLNDSGISNVYYSLSVDSKTTVNVYLEAENDVNIESAEVTGTNRPVSTDKVTRNGVEYYHVAIKNLSADELGDVYKIDVKTDQGDAVINLSAMTYVYSILNSSGYANDLTAHYAVTALYNYYMATKSYVESIS